MIRFSSWASIHLAFSSTCIYLSTFSSAAPSIFSHQPFLRCDTYDTYSLTARLFSQKRHILLEDPSHTKHVHLFRDSSISSCSTQCISMVSTNDFVFLPTTCRLRTPFKRVLLTCVGGGRFPRALTAAHMADPHILVAICNRKPEANTIVNLIVVVVIAKKNHLSSYRLYNYNCSHVRDRSLQTPTLAPAYVPTFRYTSWLHLRRPRQQSRIQHRWSTLYDRSPRPRRRRYSCIHDLSQLFGQRWHVPRPKAGIRHSPRSSRRYRFWSQEYRRCHIVQQRPKKKIGRAERGR